MVFYTHNKDLGQVLIEKKNTVTTDHTFEGDVVSAVTLGPLFSTLIDFWFGV
jgi:hypothetical protein